jgi:hypothetical protein
MVLTEPQAVSKSPKIKTAAILNIDFSLRIASLSFKK